MFGRTASMRRVDRSRALRRLAYFVPLLWLAAVVSGLGALEAYKSRPGDAGQTPAVFPNEFPQWELDSDGQSTAGCYVPLSRPRLMMFVHPRCPCSKASLGELAEIVAQRSGKADGGCRLRQTGGRRPRTGKRRRCASRRRRSRMFA